MASQFLAFDGFTMFQKHALCTSSLMPFLESTSHLTLVNGFITSWLSTAIAVRSYEDEFIVTGAIGYLLIDYVSYVYGEADGRVWLLKLYHSIVQLESQGASQGVPLVYSHADIPVGYELYSLANAALNRAKSIVFMHLLEHRIGHSAEVSHYPLYCLCTAIELYSIYLTESCPSILPDYERPRPPLAAHLLS